VVVCLSGGIGSGKTEVSRQLAERLACARASFGDYVRAVARSRGVEETRERLQALGEELVTENLRSFCVAALELAGWQRGSVLVVDGIRHLEALEMMRALVAPVPVILVHLGTPDDVRAARLSASRAHDAARLSVLDQHSTEVQVKDRLRECADVVLDGTLSVDALVASILERLADD
jgi:dephospho-CoA kinase